MLFCLKLKEWGGGKNLEFRNKIKDCRTKLRRLRSRRDNLGIQMYSAVRWEYLNLLERHESYWKQRAKQYREGDQNTFFFISMHHLGEKIIR